MGEAARGTDEVAESMTRVEAAASDTAEGADRSLRASEQLAGVAGELDDMVAAFAV